MKKFQQTFGVIIKFIEMNDRKLALDYALSYFTPSNSDDLNKHFA